MPQQSLRNAFSNLASQAASQVASRAANATEWARDQINQIIEAQPERPEEPSSATQGSYPEDIEADDGNENEDPTTVLIAHSESQSTPLPDDHQEIVQRVRTTLAGLLQTTPLSTDHGRSAIRRLTQEASRLLPRDSARQFAQEAARRLAQQAGRQIYRQQQRIHLPPHQGFDNNTLDGESFRAWMGVDHEQFSKDQMRNWLVQRMGSGFDDERWEDDDEQWDTLRGDEPADYLDQCLDDFGESEEREQWYDALEQQEHTSNRSCSGAAREVLKLLDDLAKSDMPPED